MKLNIMLENTITAFKKYIPERLLLNYQKKINNNSSNRFKNER